MIQRRTALSLVLGFAPLIGCATRYPKRGLSSVSASNADFQEPRHDQALKLQISDWARPISAAALHDEEATINKLLGPWSDIVVGRFSEVLASSLQATNIKVHRISQRNAKQNNEGNDFPSIRSFITAGFVYKTYTSATYTPFVQIVLEANLPNGMVLYHQLYAATDRSLNLFTTNLPPSTNYAFTEIESLKSEREAALQSLAALAEQLARRFAAELAA